MRHRCATPTYWAINGASDDDIYYRPYTSGCFSPRAPKRGWRWLMSPASQSGGRGEVGHFSLSERPTGASGRCSGEPTEVRERLTGAPGQRPGETKELKRSGEAAELHESPTGAADQCPGEPKELPESPTGESSQSSGE